MNVRQLLLVIAVQTAQVAGQLLLKKGMSGDRRRIASVAGGTVLLAVWFFGWLRLLQELDISFLYPFEGLSLIGLVLAARVFLRERLEGRTWIGVALIGAGMLLVGGL